MSTSFRKLPRGWNDAQLLEDAQLVNIAPMFYRLAVRETEDMHLVPRDLPAGGRDTQELSPVRATGCRVMHHLISLGYLCIHRIVNVRKRGAEDGGELFVPFATRRETGRWEVVISIDCYHFIECGCVPLVKAFKREAASESLDIFGC
jgi:hypothetical protein